MGETKTYSPMKTEIRTYGNLKNGQPRAIQHDGHTDLDTHLEAWGDVPIVITYSLLYESHSRQAEGYYRKVVLPIATTCICEAWGEDFTKEQIHLVLKNLYNNGESTSSLDSYEYMKFTDRVRRMVKEIFDVTIPDPLRIENVSQKLRL